MLLQYLNDSMIKNLWWFLIYESVLNFSDWLSEPHFCVIQGSLLYEVAELTLCIPEVSKSGSPESAIDLIFKK